MAGYSDNYENKLLEATAGKSRAITAASNATPIVITSNSHPFSNGDIVAISGVGGNLAANGIFVVANKATNTFELTDGAGANIAGSAAYTSGGKAQYCGSYPDTRLYLALVTVAVTESMTGATITEATYTGYARKAVLAADWNAAASGAITNANQLAFANCTAGSSTIIGWALCDSSATGAGNVVMSGTCTSTVISSTQTPPTVAAAALSLSLD